MDSRVELLLTAALYPPVVYLCARTAWMYSRVIRGRVRAFRWRGMEALEWIQLGIFIGFSAFALHATYWGAFWFLDLFRVAALHDWMGNHGYVVAPLRAMGAGAALLHLHAVWVEVGRPKKWRREVVVAAFLCVAAAVTGAVGVAIAGG